MLDSIIKVIKYLIGKCFQLLKKKFGFGKKNVGTSTSDYSVDKSVQTGFYSPNLSGKKTVNYFLDNMKRRRKAPVYLFTSSLSLCDCLPSKRIRIEMGKHTKNPSCSCMAWVPDSRSKFGVWTTMPRH